MHYVVGIIIVGLTWLPFYIYRRDLRKDMIWSGLYYMLILSFGFILIKFVAPNLSPERTIVPGYWNPDTLFNLGRITGGYALEDAVYMFFTGGIAAALYETLFRKKLGHIHLKHRPHYALLTGLIAATSIYIFLPVNLIYVLIGFGFSVALVICLQRNDLIPHVILGGISYLFVYTVLSLIFLGVYPNYVHDYYSVQNLSGILLSRVPLEEYLFAFSFGLSWSPIYEYVRGIKDIKQ